MPVHIRSVTTSSKSVLSWLAGTTLAPDLSASPTITTVLIWETACAASRPHTHAMTEVEIRQRVKEILLKGDIGDDLTSQEVRILAHAYYAAGEQPVRMRAGPDTETG